MRKINYYLFFLLIAPCAIILAEGQRWPAIQPLHEERTFVNPGRSNSDTPFVALVRSKGGTPVYKIDCHNGNYEDESEMNFSGDFQCALFAISGKKVISGNLLATDTKDELSTDWWNRGRMRSIQLWGDCLRYPEYSTLMHFKLREMRITLSFNDVQWSAEKDQQDNPLLARFTFVVEVTPDSSANSSRGEQVPGPKPPMLCYP